MASPSIFAFARSALNPFLYADIGPPDAAGTLTVASLFGRHGCDPWAEAARLARLPAGMAAASLAAMIEAMPVQRYSPQDAGAMADRLVRLLPHVFGDAERTGERAGRGPPHRLAAFTLGLGVMVAFLALWLALADAWAPRAGGDQATATGAERIRLFFEPENR